MAKTINWPSGLEEEIINEDMNQIRTAFRIGTIYHENGYYTPGEIVDIRVDGKVIRKGEIQGETELHTIKNIHHQDLQSHKKGSQDIPSLIQHLGKRYDQPVNDEIVVTVIRYRNRELIENEDVSDPHM